MPIQHAHSELGKLFVAATFQDAIDRYFRMELCRAYLAQDWVLLKTILKKVDQMAWERAKQEINKAAEHEIAVVTFDSEDYPKRLRQIPDPPLTLFVRGVIPSQSAFVVSIVGSREATPYGLRHAYRLAEEIVAAGGIVVSGLARGIDGAAHRGAISGARNEVARRNTQPHSRLGRSFSAGVAVLGSGVLSIYPAQHEELAATICELQGAVVSEYPLFSTPRKHTFPERNRIISGLSDAVIVAEAGDRSGALITARCALEQGREVFSLPGPVESRNSKGTLRLLREGAHIVQNISDIFDSIPRLRALRQESDFDLQANPGKRRAISQKKMERGGGHGQVLRQSFEGREREVSERILRLLEAEDLCPFDRIVEQTGLSSSAAQAVLLRLELDEIVFQRPGNVYSFSRLLN